MRTVISSHIFLSLIIATLCLAPIKAVANKHPKNNETIIIAGTGPSTTIVQ